MRRNRIVVAAASLLWVAHMGVVTLMAAAAPRQILSDAIQLALGMLLIYAIAEVSRRSEGFALSFWRLTLAAYLLWFFAQGLGFYSDFHSSAIGSWIANLLFCFWFAPMAMAMFLDPEREAGLDTPVILDFAQAILVCIAAYLYFFYLPKSDSAGELAHSVWAPYFVGYGFVVAAFLLRAAVTHDRDVRTLLGRMGLFMSFSGLVDAVYYYGPGHGIDLGSKMDILWSALLIAPMIIAITWKQAEAPEFSREATPREKHIYAQMFPLLYPLLVLFMSLRIARERLGLAAVVVLLSFLCSSSRQLVTQHRMLLVKDALRREAAHDSLTSVWNRKAIFEILERELQRAERDQQPVGLIMIDVDHFKTINDTRGHAAGDVVLRIIAGGIAAMVRPYDSVGRYGGEEFLIVAPGCGITETWELAERVRSHVANCNIMAGGSAVKVSLSLGIANGQCAGEIEKLLHTADAALYEAKNAGRNRVAPAVKLGHAAGASSGSSNPPSDFWL